MTESFDRDQLYEDYVSKVRGYITSRISYGQEAEDLVSSVFLKIYEKIELFDPSKASLSTWIYRITQNTLIDYFRTRRVSAPLPDEIGCTEGEIDDDLLREESLEELADALEVLPERERHLIILRYYKGCTLREIAGRLGFSYANAKLLHAKALSSLRKSMKL